MCIWHLVPWLSLGLPHSFWCPSSVMPTPVRRMAFESVIILPPLPIMFQPSGRIMTGLCVLCGERCGIVCFAMPCVFSGLVNDPRPLVPSLLICNDFIPRTCIPSWFGSLFNSVLFSVLHGSLSYFLFMTLCHSLVNVSLSLKCLVSLVSVVFFVIVPCDFSLLWVLFFVIYILTC